jgi:AbrB family looped-hinge helix DNA binding protein
MPEELNNFMSCAKVGPKGQIVIPKEIRDMFGIESGDSLVIMADRARGIAIHKQEVMEGIARAIFDGQGPAIYPREDQGGLAHFAEAITKASGGEEIKE